MPSRPRSRARGLRASFQPHQRGQTPGHRSRGRTALPATPAPAPERRAEAAGRCTPRCSRGTLKDGRRRPDALLKPQGSRRLLFHAVDLSITLDSTFRSCFYLADLAKDCLGQRNAGLAQRERPSQSSPRPFALPPPAPTCALSQQGRRPEPSHRPSHIQA